MKKISGSVPGKIIITGEHSIVRGQVALLATIDMRVKVEVTAITQTQVVLDSDQLPGIKKLTRQQAINYWQQTDQAWSKFNDNINPKPLRNLWQDEYLVLIASVGYVLSQFPAPKSGFYLKIESQIPISSGFGSSASVATAVIGTLSHWLGLTLSLEKLCQASYQIEKLVHGKPSGGDVFIGVHGNMIQFQKTDNQFDFQQIPLKGTKLPQIMLVHSGQPTENTGEMVALVSQKLNQDQSKYQSIINRMGQVSNQFISSLKKGSFSQDLLQLNERLLEELGVVGAKAKHIISQIESIGGVAKISGAGGVKTGSGVLLCLHQDMSQLVHLAQTNHWTNYLVDLGGNGWQLE